MRFLMEAAAQRMMERRASPLLVFGVTSNETQNKETTVELLASAAWISGEPSANWLTSVSSTDNKVLPALGVMGWLNVNVIPVPVVRPATRQFC